LTAWPSIVRTLPYGMGHWLDHPLRKTLTGLTFALIFSALGVLYGEVTGSQESAGPFLIMSILLASWFGGLLGGLAGTLLANVVFILYAGRPSGDFQTGGTSFWFFIAFLTSSIAVNLFNAWRRSVEQELVDTSEELWRSRSHLEAVLHSEVTGILEIDTDGRFIAVNDRFCELVGRSREELTPEFSCYDVIHPDDRGSLRLAMDSLARGEQHFTLEMRYVRPNGWELWVHHSAKAFRDSAGRAQSVEAVATDLSEQKQAELVLRDSEESLRRANDLKDQFLGLISHELRTPISTIIGNGLLLQRRGDMIGEEDKAQALDDVVSEAQRLQAIIENLLSLTKVEATAGPEVEPSDLITLVEETVDKFRNRRPKRAVLVQVDERLPLVSTNPVLVVQVLENLLSNADKYSPEDLPIEIKVERTSDTFVGVSVKDHGVGIDESEAESIFTPFYRSPSVKAQVSGMGIGLAVSKRMIEAMGGSITTRRRPEGGSEFTFMLPG
jgi:PAS domain S-box-containing protein